MSPTAFSAFPRRRISPVPRASRRYGRDRAGARVLGGVSQIELDPEVVERAALVEPASLSSLDAIHLATAALLLPELAHVLTYDDRMAEAAASYGWNNPDWAQSGGRGPYEPWHWEYFPGEKDQSSGD